VRVGAAGLVQEEAGAPAAEPGTAGAVEPAAAVGPEAAVAPAEAAGVEAAEEVAAAVEVAVEAVAGWSGTCTTGSGRGGRNSRARTTH
jgi:hypothetical protein